MNRSDAHVDADARHAIHFVCPSCSAEHRRGYVDGVDTFRCLRCGYVGHGHHPDHEIDAAVHAEILENRAWDEARGLPAGPMSP